MSLRSWLFGKPRRPPIPKSVIATVYSENEAFFGRSTPTCERCLGWAKAWVRPRRKRFHLDHVVAFANDPYQRVKAAAFQVLCDLCNVSKGKKWRPSWKALNRLGLLGLPLRLVVLVYERITPARYS